MDFPGGSITNIRAIDGFSSIYYRIYTEEQSIPNVPREASSNAYTILRHLSRLKDLELRLRNLDCLVSCIPRRLGLWIFSATPDFENLRPLCSREPNEQGRIYIGSSTLKVSASGSVTSSDLVKTLSSDHPSTGGNQSGSQRPQNASAPPRRADSYGSSALIYALFLSAVTGALNLQLIRRNNAIPLGPRTLFTVVERDCNDNPGVIINDTSSVPCLATLQVQLTTIGKLTVSLQTISQPGLKRVRQPNDSLADTTHALTPGTDLWLSPSGTIARLVSTSPGTVNSSSPYPGTSFLKNDMITADPKQWKTTVLEWLKNFGLEPEPTDDISWVMVEVWEPFYSRLAGETWRPSDSSSTIPLKRILWPDIYCFRRAKSTVSDPVKWMGDDITDPLDFAQSWHQTVLPTLQETSPNTQPDQQESLPKDQDTFSTNDIPEGVESLSRASHYPELQTASLVYPTPPDGAAGLGLNAMAPSETFGDDSDLGSSVVQNPGRLRYTDPSSTNERSELPPMDFGPSAGLMVGSGLYDTNEDDDLFGDMNERDFGAKGITDADFSFFDNPDFDGLGGGLGADGVGDMSDLMDSVGPATQPPVDEDVLAEAPVVEAASVQQAPMAQVSHADEIAESGATQTPVQDTVPDPLPQREQSQSIISPPLSPVEVKKILFPGTNGNLQPSTRKGKSQSYYNPITFKEDVSAWDQKYGATGKFKFNIADPSPSKNFARFENDIPTIGLPRRNRRLPVVTGLARNLDGHDSPSSEALQQDDLISDSGSDSSDDSDDALSEGDASTTVLSNLKRKRGRSNSGTSLALSQAKSMEGDKGTPAPKIDHSIFLGNFLSTSSDWSMTGYFSFQENQLFPALGGRDFQVQIAQLLVDQVTQSSLDHKLDGICSLSDLEVETYSIQTFLEDSSIMGGIERLDLNSFVSLQDNGAVSPAVNDPSRQPAQRKDPLKGSVSKLTPPYLRVRRGKEFLEALPPSIFFWETFGLEPAYGQKDVFAYCIHPRIAASAADAFLDRLGLEYSSCHLGKHVRGDKHEAFDRGLGSWDIASDDMLEYSTAMQTLKNICEDLGNAFLKSPPSKDNLVIYIINPFSHAAALIDICSAFWGLFQKYISDADKQQTLQLNELVLQVVPIDFIMSAESLVIPPQTQYLNLALEVYSRCPPRDQETSLVNCAPPVLLAEPLPKHINFRLASEKFSPLQEGKCLHIASSRSQDQRWITVAWSDNTGALQRSMSYNLRFRNASASRTLQDVRSEVWSATKDIMERMQARWRIVLVNSEPVDQEEVDSWTNFVDQHNKTNASPVELTILNVNPMPDLYLDPPVLPIPMSVFNPQASSTPIATPNPNILSPDQTGNASTPPSAGYGVANAPTPTDGALEAESEALLTDVSDDSWAVTLSHRLNSSPHLMDHRPALASGYLLRRKGATDGDGVYTMTVNLIYTQRPSSSYDTLLREILQMYRDLATLARIRGTRTVQRSAMPWHIATAIRAQETLSYVL